MEIDIHACCIDEGLDADVVQGCLNVMRDLGGFDALALEELRSGHVKLSFRTSSRMSNPQGTLHGGFFMAVADMAACMASHSRGHVPVTLQANFDFCRPIPIDGGRAEFSADVVHDGKTVQLVEVKAANERGEACLRGSFLTFAKAKVEDTGGYPTVEQTLEIVRGRFADAGRPFA